MEWIEDMVVSWFPNSKIINWQKWVRIPVLGHICISPLRLVNRTVLVVATTVIVSSLHHNSSLEHAAHRLL